MGAGGPQACMPRNGKRFSIMPTRSRDSSRPTGISFPGKSDRRGCSQNGGANAPDFLCVFNAPQSRCGALGNRTFFERLRTLDAVSARPFILALFRRCQGQTDILRAVLVAIESFLVRRMVCRLSTRGYTDAFADLTPRPDGAPAEALED